MKTFLKKRVLKRKITNAFSLSGLYYSAKWNGKTVRQFPQVLDVRTYEDRTVFVFRLPHSVDPDLVKKKEYVFKSIFGENIEFKGTYPMTLTVYHITHIGAYDFNADEWERIMKPMRLPIIAGKDKNGKLVAYDMTKNPHLLIAGETGSGKSVMLRSILTSLIGRPRVQLFLADLKRSEFHLFRKKVRTVITDKKELKRCVKWLHNELERRGDLLDEHELSHIDDLPEPPDYLILCIDEFSILRKENDTLERLQDLTALGRALGIFVILSTQRPDRTIVDGLLKANLTVRYAFRHADSINSRITLGDGCKIDASSIDEEQKGRFVMRFNGEHELQAPYLTVERAKELLEGVRSPEPEKPLWDDSVKSGDVFQTIESE